MKSSAWLLLAATLLSACSREAPATVCTAPQTIEAVRDLLTDMVARNVRDLDDQQHLRSVFDELVSIDLITLEGFDEQTSSVRCRARASLNAGAERTFAYERQPDLSSGDYVYSIDLREQIDWSGIIMPVAAEYRRSIGGPTRSPSDQSAPSKIEPTDARSDQVASRHELPLGPKLAPATVFQSGGLGTASAYMRGRVRPQDVARWCSQFDNPDCRSENTASANRDIVISANCPAGTLLAASGQPFSRTIANGEPVWRDDTSGEVLDGSVASEAPTFEAQYAVLCPDRR